MNRLIPIILALLALFVSLPGSVQAQSKGRNYAFLVACGEYENDKEFGNLPFTVKEMLEFRDVLLASGEYKEEDMKVLHNGAKEKRYQPRRKRIVEELDILLNLLNEEDSLLVVFNGHGIQPKGESAYFCPTDASVEEIKSCIPLEGKNGLFEKLKETKLKRKLLIVNACRDDPNKPTMASRKVDLFDTRHKIESPEGIAALFSCQPGQFSYYYPDEKETKGRQRSLFFHHLIEGWQGHYSAGKEINLEDVFREVKERTGRDADKLFGDSQVPFMRREYAKEWVIARGRGVALLGSPIGGSAQFLMSKTLPEMKLMRIPEGSFTMGAPETENGRSKDEVQHRVTISRAFYMGEHTVTVAQWRVFMRENPSHDAKAGEKPSFYQSDYHPVVNVSHDDALAFCAWLGKKDGREYMLPTEAQWEYACRAGTKTSFNVGEELGSMDANFNDNLTGTSRVGSYKANAFGLYDMHGNVWQWCSDWSGDYSTGEVTDPAGPANGSIRVYRGGGWNSIPGICRSAYRNGYSPVNRFSILGFRVACPVGE